MLTAEYLINVAAPMVELWGNVESDILADITRRLIKGTDMTETAAWQTMKLREMGVLQTEISKTLASTMKRNEKQLYKMIADACREALTYDDRLYMSAGLKPIRMSESKALMDLISAGIRRTEGVMRNFTGTTAIDASKAFGNALDRAWLQVSSGAFTRQEALRRAVDDLATMGITGVAYPSGHHDKMDVAARRALITGINQTVANVQLARMDEMGCDLVETTSHAGARPTHAVWQGQIFSKSGTHSHYKDFYAETGYGTGDGLCGWNCYHSFYPYFEGISTQAFERDPAARLGKSNDQVYEESQTQRYLERKIRESKRECVAYDTARKETQDPVFKEQLDSEFTHSSVVLKKREAALKDFCRRTDRTTIAERMSVHGFGRSESSKAVWAARKANSGIIQMIVPGSELPPAQKSRFSDVTDEYRKSLIPGIGIITRELGWKDRSKGHEQKIADEIVRAIGGSVEMVDNAGNVSKPDIRWAGHEWEIKSASSLRAADDQMHKAIVQTRKYDGDIMIDFISVEYDEAIKIMKHRIARSADKGRDIVVFRDGKFDMILRYKK